MNTPVTGTPRLILRLEGAAVFVAAIAAYRTIGGSWWLFAGLLLVPDLALLAYAAGPRAGAAAYNALHTYLGPALLAGLGMLGAIPSPWSVCLIWVAHIGMDRMFGIGLKFPTAFRDTHLGIMKRILLIAALVFPSASAAQPPAVRDSLTTVGAFAGISVSDIEASTRWYVEKLGMRVIFDPPAQGGTKARVVAGSGMMIELLKHPEATTQGDPADFRRHGIFKVGFVVEGYDQLLATLRQRQVPIVIGPFPKRGDQPANFIIRDNAGNMLQFFGK